MYYMSEFKTRTKSGNGEPRLLHETIVGQLNAATVLPAGEHITEELRITELDMELCKSMENPTKRVLMDFESDTHSVAVYDTLSHLLSYESGDVVLPMQHSTCLPLDREAAQDAYKTIRAHTLTGEERRYTSVQAQKSIGSVAVPTMLQLTYTANDYPEQAAPWCSFSRATLIRDFDNGYRVEQIAGLDPLADHLPERDFFVSRLDVLRGDDWLSDDERLAKVHEFREQLSPMDIPLIALPASHWLSTLALR